MVVTPFFLHTTSGHMLVCMRCSCAFISDYFVAFLFSRLGDKRRKQTEVGSSEWILGEVSKVASKFPILYSASLKRFCLISTQRVAMKWPSGTSSHRISSRYGNYITKLKKKERAVNIILIPYMGLRRPLELHERSSINIFFSLLALPSTFY